MVLPSMHINMSGPQWGGLLHQNVKGQVGSAQSARFNQATASRKS